MSNYKKDVDNMRAAMGTLPSQAPKKAYSWKNSLDALYVKMNDWTKNPYHAMTSMAAATWGDNETGSTGKWENLTPENRYRIVLSVLTGNTLPQAGEAVQFTFEVNGTPRHTFDQHARARVGTAFASIGTRDNNKLDADFLFYPDVCRRMEEDPTYRERVEQWIKTTKDLYEETISSGTGTGSWQSGRAFLPMSTNHSYVFTQNYLALKGQCARRLMACEESSIVALHIALRELVGRKFPLLANYLRPACDGARRCIYHEGPEGMTKYFSSLFACCGRWPTKEQYSEFNVSCSDYAELEKHGFMMPGPGPDGWTWTKYGENDFDKLHPLDIALFTDIPTDRVFVNDQWVHINQGPEIFDARK
jgi:thymidylate synthase ThyX